MFHFLSGRVGLFKSFWFVAFPLAIIFNVVIYFSPLEPGSIETKLFLLLVASITIVVVVGVWKSAGLYEGAIAWRYLGKIWCAINLILVVLPIAGGLIVAGNGALLSTLHEKDVVVKVELCKDEKKYTFDEDFHLIHKFVVDAKERTVKIISKVMEKEASEWKITGTGITELQKCVVVDKRNWKCNDVIEWNNRQSISDDTHIVVDGKYNFGYASSGDKALCALRRTQID